MKEIKGKGISITVDGTQVDYYMEGKLVAQTYYFESKEKKDGNAIVRFNNTWGKLKGIAGITLTGEQYQEVIDYIEETEKEINTYFENIKTAELKELSNGSIIFTETEELKKLKELNKSHFYKVEKTWINENKKYFDKKIDWKENGIGMMESTTTYTFTTEKLEEIEKELKEYKQTEEYKEIQKEKQESEKRYNELRKLATELSDEDFEDVTGLKKEFLLDI